MDRPTIPPRRTAPPPQASGESRTPRYRRGRAPGLRSPAAPILGLSRPAGARLLVRTVTGDRHRTTAHMLKLLHIATLHYIRILRQGVAAVLVARLGPSRLPWSRTRGGRPGPSRRWSFLRRETNARAVERRPSLGPTRPGDRSDRGGRPMRQGSVPGRRPWPWQWVRLRPPNAACRAACAPSRAASDQGRSGGQNPAQNGCRSGRSPSRPMARREAAPVVGRVAMRAPCPANSARRRSGLAIGRAA
jgi:hypothetical protein